MTLEAAQEELKRMTLRWASSGELDEERAATLRARVAGHHHAHYREHIPHYRRLCEQAGVDDHADLDTIRRALMVPDDVFKSYPSRLLDEGDFAGMNDWLGRITDRRVEATGSRPTNIDEWVESLAAGGMHLVFSSGTSGHMSFVPRHSQTWDAFLSLGYLYLPALLARRGLLPGWKRVLLRLASRVLSPARLMEIVRRHGLREFDGFFLNFSGGNQGIQLVGQETAKLVGRAVFLYPKKMSPAAVRAIVRGPRTREEEALVRDLLETTVARKHEHYDRLADELATSIRRRRKVILFGTPYLLLELCDRLAARGGRYELPRGSHITFGGGWKSFTGERIPTGELLGRVQSTFGLPASAVIEGYSMTEIQGLMVRCSADRYHVPPFLETVLLDEALRPLDGADATGNLGIIDPFADSYPGFLITGDYVHRMQTPCECGLPGATILQVERSPDREVKGCGGIMAAVNA